LKKIQIKIFIESSRIQQEKQIKDTVNIYIKKIIKDLEDKTFKHHTYIKHYNTALNFAKDLKLEKTSNMIFNKESRISKNI